VLAPLPGPHRRAAPLEILPGAYPDHHERVCRTVRECIEKWEPKGFAIAHGAPPDLMRALQARGLVRDFLG